MMDRPPEVSQRSRSRQLLGSPRLVQEWLLLGLVLLAVGVFLAWSRYDDRQTLAAEQRDLLADGAAAIERDLTRQLIGVVNALNGVRTDLPAWPANNVAGRGTRRLTALTSAMPGVRQMMLLDRRGRVLAASEPAMLGVELGAQHWFQQALAAPDPQRVHLSLPEIATPGEHTLYLTLALPGNDAQSAGAVTAVLDPTYLRNVLRGALHAADAWASIARGDGPVLMFEPRVVDIAGRDLDRPGSLFRRHRDTGLAASMMTGIVAATGDERLIAQRTVRPAGLAIDLPLVIAVSRNLQAMYLPWRHESAADAGLYALLVLMTSAALLAMQRRQRALDALQLQRESHERKGLERLGLALRGADLGLWDLDLRTGDSVVSERWNTMLGLPHQAVHPASDGWRSRVHPEDLDRILAAKQAHLQGHNDRFDELYRLRHADGHWVWVLDRGQVLERDGAGHALRMVGTLMDVTEKTEQERTLRANEVRLRSLLDNLRSGVIVHGPDTHVIDANPEACRIVGLTLDQLHGKVAVDPYWSFLEEDHSVMGLARYPVAQVLASGEALKNFVLGVRRPDLQRPLWVLVDAYPQRSARGHIEQIVVTFSEITERKEAEEELRLLALAVARLHDVVMITEAEPLDAPGPRIKFVNDAFEHLTGWSRTEVIGNSPRILQGPRTDRSELARVGSALRKGEPVHAELINYTKNGEPYWIEMDIVAIADRSGRIVHHVAVERVITERKNAEQRVLAAQGELQATLEAVPDLLFDIDLDGTYHACHSPRRELLYPSAGSLIGQTMSQVLPTEAATVTMAALRQAHAVGVSVGLQYELALPHGRCWFELSVARKPGMDGQVPRFVVLARDISDRKRAESGLQRLNRSLRVLSSCNINLVQIHDESVYLAQVCRAIVRAGGYLLAWVGFAENDPGKSIRIVAHAGRTDTYVKSLELSWDGARMAGQGPSGTAIRTCRTQVNQNWRANPHVALWRKAALDHGYQSSIALPLVSGTTALGTLTLYAGEPDAFDPQELEPLEELARNVTVAIESLRTRRQRDAAQDANRAKTAFLANMSHEIRTPLNAIIGLNYLMRSEGVTPKQSARLDKIDNASQHLLSIINDVLDLSKIESGRVQLESTDFHLSAILDAVHSIIAETARAKGLHVEVDRDAVPLWLRGDQTRLRQALLNFAGNAVKFTERGSIALRAKLLKDQDDELLIRFSVEDTGIGIPADQIGRLFQAFEQADASTTRRFGGTGLGLSITQRLAQLMNGECGVLSTPGVGSTFWFTARLQRGRGAMPVLARAVDPSADEQLRRRHRGARVLLVEDNEVNREVALALLHSVGLNVDAAADGTEALALARTSVYDLVLMDVQMPRMGGLQATQEIRRLPGWAKRPILALTANAFEEDRLDCERAGMNDFVSKPMDVAALWDCLLKWLDIGAAERSSPAPDASSRTSHDSPGDSQAAGPTRG